MSYQVLQRVTGRRETRRIDLPIVEWPMLFDFSVNVNLPIVEFPVDGVNVIAATVDGVFVTGSASTFEHYDQFTLRQAYFPFEIKAVRAGLMRYWVIDADGGVWIVNPWDHGNVTYQQVDTGGVAMRKIYVNDDVNYNFWSTSIFAISQAGELYVWGYNPGFFGLGHKNNLQVFTKVSGFADSIVDVITNGSLGDGALVLTKSGEVYGAGFNWGGTLGLGSQIEFLTFTKAETPVPIKKISNAGRMWQCTFLLGVNGQVYITGAIYGEHFVPFEGVSNVKWI